MTIGRRSEGGGSTFLKAITSQSAVRVEVLIVRWEKALEKSERSSFTFKQRMCVYETKLHRIATNLHVYRIAVR
jgi:hypothetical protein